MLPLAGWAVIETYDFSSPDLEVRYHSLSQELRCPKCQNQNIADSNAPIARDLRVVLYEQLEAGASDDEILAFMVARYGEFVRYRPGVDRNTLLLWTSPVLLLLAGAVGLTRALLIFVRAVPEYVWAFLLVKMFGFGAWPAVLALALHNSGILRKLMAETVENVEAGPAKALRGLGATRL